MTPQPFPTVQTFSTHHCITGSLRHIYESHGYPISEELLLGLGSGVGFAYFHFKGADPFYGGRANFERPSEEGLEKTCGRRTGVAVESHVTKGRAKAERELLGMLKARELAMVYVDMGFLPYLDLPPGYHFGGHTIVITGLDEPSRTVLAADRDETMHALDLDALAEARGSTFKPFPPHNKWYTFDFDSARPPSAGEVRDAIRDVCHGMLEPPIANLGVKGIRTAAERTRRWPEIMDEAALRRSCFNAAIFIDATGGTGGGIFRYMYGRFLREAAAITGETRLEKLGAAFSGVGDQWEAVAAAFRRASAADDSAASLPNAIEPMSPIAATEQDLWEELARLVA